jgi:hypothetical protein
MTIFVKSGDAGGRAAAGVADDRDGTPVSSSAKTVLSSRRVRKPGSSRRTFFQGGAEVTIVLQSMQ